MYARPPPRKRMRSSALQAPLRSAEVEESISRYFSGSDRVSLGRVLCTVLEGADVSILGSKVGCLKVSEGREVRLVDVKGEDIMALSVEDASGEMKEREDVKLCDNISISVTGYERGMQMCDLVCRVRSRGGRAVDRHVRMDDFVSGLVELVNTRATDSAEDTVETLINGFKKGLCVFPRAGGVVLGMAHPSADVPLYSCVPLSPVENPECMLMGLRASDIKDDPAFCTTHKNGVDVVTLVPWTVCATMDGSPPFQASTMGIVKMFVTDYALRWERREQGGVLKLDVWGMSPLKSSKMLAFFIWKERSRFFGTTFLTREQMEQAKNALVHNVFSAPEIQQEILARSEWAMDVFCTSMIMTRGSKYLTDDMWDSVMAVIKYVKYCCLFVMGRVLGKDGEHTGKFHVEHDDPLVPVDARRMVMHGPGQRCTFCHTMNRGECLCIDGTRGPEPEVGAEIEMSIGVLEKEGHRPEFWRNVMQGWCLEDVNDRIPVAERGNVAKHCARLWRIFKKVVTPTCPCCNSLYEREHGCSHMSCYECGTHFCHICSRPFFESDQPSQPSELIKELTKVVPRSTKILDLVRSRAMSTVNVSNLVHVHSDIGPLVGTVKPTDHERCRGMHPSISDRFFHYTETGSMLSCEMFVKDYARCGPEQASVKFGTLLSPAFSELHNTVSQLAGVEGNLEPGLEVISRMCRILHTEISCGGLHSLASVDFAFSTVLNYVRMCREFGSQSDAIHSLTPSGLLNLFCDSDSAECLHHVQGLLRTLSVMSRNLGDSMEPLIPIVPCTTAHERTVYLMVPITMCARLWKYVASPPPPLPAPPQPPAPPPVQDTD